MAMTLSRTVPMGVSVGIGGVGVRRRVGVAVGRAGRCRRPVQMQANDIHAVHIA